MPYTITLVFSDEEKAAAVRTLNTVQNIHAGGRFAPSEADTLQQDLARLTSTSMDTALQVDPAFIRNRGRWDKGASGE